MDKKALIVISDDSFGRQLINHLGKEWHNSIVLDYSTNFKRILRLILKRRIPLFLVIRMFLAELRRPKLPIPKLDKVHNNQELYKKIKANQIEEVYLFRAGLIINKKLIESGVKFLNIHCCSIPEFGGLASIFRALQAQRYDQFAVLHHVTTSIDTGEVIAQNPYKLDPLNSYGENENTAYSAGMDLLFLTLKNLSNQS